MSESSVSYLRARSFVKRRQRGTGADWGGVGEGAFWARHKALAKADRLHSPQGKIQL